MRSRSFLPWMTRVVVLILRRPLMILTRRDWQDADKLPHDSGYVLAPNHNSHLDPILISHWMVDHRISPRFLAKDTLFDVPVIGWIVTHATQIPVFRGTAGAAESLRAAADAVEAGGVVTIYPEGTLTRDPDTWPMSGRTGAVRVALMTGKPLVPLMQDGAQEILWPYTKRFRFFPRKTIHIRVGDPIDLSPFRDREITEDLLHDATNLLMDTLTSMLADHRGELPTSPRIDVHSLKRSKTNRKELDS